MNNAPFYTYDEHHVKVPKLARVLFIITAFAPTTIAHFILTHPTWSNLHLTDSITGSSFLFAFILASLYYFGRFTPATLMLQTMTTVPVMLIIALNIGLAVSFLFLLSVIALFIAASVLISKHQTKIEESSVL